MKTEKKYIAPDVNFIEIDHEISLVLESPPEGPEEGFNNKTPEFFNQDAPLKA